MKCQDLCNNRSVACRRLVPTSGKISYWYLCSGLWTAFITKVSSTFQLEDRKYKDTFSHSAPKTISLPRHQSGPGTPVLELLHLMGFLEQADWQREIFPTLASPAQ